MEPFRVGAAQRQAEPRPGRVGAQRALLGPGRAVEQHLLDARVIVEVFDVPTPLSAAADVRVE